MFAAFHLKLWCLVAGEAWTQKKSQQQRNRRSFFTFASSPFDILSRRFPQPAVHVSVLTAHIYTCLPFLRRSRRHVALFLFQMNRLSSQSQTAQNAATNAFRVVIFLEFGKDNIVAWLRIGNATQSVQRTRRASGESDKWTLIEQRKIRIELAEDGGSRHSRSCFANFRRLTRQQQKIETCTNLRKRKSSKPSRCNVNNFVIAAEPR